MKESSVYLEQIKDQAAYLFAASVFYGGYSFFEFSKFYDAVILMLFTVAIFTKKSRVASVLASAFGLLILYLLFQNSEAASLMYIVALAIVWCGAMSTCWTVMYHKSLKITKAYNKPFK
jgi:predicted membrane protein